MTIYSIRDAFDGELWWTTKRKSAIEVVTAINAVTVTPGHTSRAFWRTNGQTVSKDIRHGQLPAAVYKCTKIKEAP